METKVNDAGPNVHIIFVFTRCYHEYECTHWAFKATNYKRTLAIITIRNTSNVPQTFGSGHWYFHAINIPLEVIPILQPPEQQSFLPFTTWRPQNRPTCATQNRPLHLTMTRVFTPNMPPPPEWKRVLPML